MINDGSAHLRQKTNYTCGRAASAIVLRIHGENRKEKDMVKLPAHPDDGCPPDAIIRYFKNRRFPHKHKFAKPAIRSLEKMIDRGWPVIVAYQDWADRPSEIDYSKTWDNGHYSVLVGYDEERFWFIDPSSDKKRRSIEKKEFEGRWRDISAKGKVYHNWGLAIGPKKKR